MLFRSTIQAALEAATEGETIEVAPGVYSEDIGCSVNNLTLKGPNSGVAGDDSNRKEEAIINGQVVLSADSIVFEGFKVSPSAATSHLESAALRISNSPNNVLVRNNIIHDFSEDGLEQGYVIDGILASGGVESNAIENIRINDNLVFDLNGRSESGGAAAISIEGNVDGAKVKNNVIRDIGMGETAWAFGVTVRGTANHDAVPANVTVENNDIENIISNPGSSTCGVGLGLEKGSATFTANQVSNAEYLFEDKTSTAGLDAIIAGNDFDRAVSLSSNDDIVWGSIQDAIDSAEAGDTVLVAAGTYNETITIDVKDVTIQSSAGSAYTTIEEYTEGGKTVKIDTDGVTLDGFTVNGDSSYGSKAINVIKGGTSGITIKNCNASAWEPILVTSSGTSHTGLTIRNNVLHDGYIGACVFTTDDSLIQNNKFYNLDDIGLQMSIWDTRKVSNQSVPTGNVIRKNSFDKITNQDIFLQAKDTLVEYNDILGGGKWGVAVVDEIEAYDAGNLNVSGNVIQFNNIDNHAEYGVGVASYNGDLNVGYNGHTVDADKNYWGASDGPSGEGLSTVGDAVSTNVTYEPFFSDAEMTMLAYDSDDPNVNEDTEVAPGETMTVSGTLSIGPDSTITVNDGKLDARRVDMEKGSIIDVLDGEMKLGTAGGGSHTMAGTFTIFNSFGSMIIDSDTTFSGDTLMLISDIHVAKDVTIEVSGSLVLDGSIMDCMDEDGSFSINVTDTGNLTMERTELYDAALTLNGDDALVRNNQFWNVDVTVASGDGNQVYHNVKHDQSTIDGSGGTNTVLSLDGWGNISDVINTQNDLDLLLTGDLLGDGRTQDGDGDVFIQPGDKVEINMDVAKLSDKISGVEAMLGFSTDYFDSDSSSLVGVSPWDNETHNEWYADGVYGKIDSAIGLSVEYPDVEGTNEDGTVANIELGSLTGAEGITQFYFRPRMAGDDSMAQNKLTGYDETAGESFELEPFTMNTSYITVDGTAPSIDSFTATQTQVDCQGDNPTDVNVFDHETNKTHQGDINFTVNLRDELAGIDDEDVVLEISSNGSVVAAPSVNSSKTVDIGGEEWTQYTFTQSIDASTPNGEYSVTVRAEDRSGNESTVLSGTFAVQKNEVSVDVVLDGESGSSFDREIVFTATDSSGSVLKTWTKTVNFDSTNKATPSLTLYESPDNLEHLSAKTDCNLRSRVAVTEDNGTTGESGQTAAALTGDDKLPGGDLNGDNLVNMQDYAILRYHWYKTNDTADITGNGGTNSDDFTILQNNWYTSGDPE